MDKKVKEPYFAFLLSMLLPGLGQVYAGKPIRGIFLFLIVAALNGGATVYFFNPATKVSLYCVIPTVLSIVVVLWCLFDSYFSAKRYNAAGGLKRIITPGVRIVFFAAIVSVPLVYYLAARPATSIIQARLCRFYIAPPNSMEPTIYKGERVLVDMTAYKKSAPKRGDVVIYRYPQEPGKIYLHRIVGFPGEAIELKDQKIVINGAKLTESWAAKIRHYNGGKLARKGMKAIVVPQDSYYVLGDDAARSQDSRYRGCLSKEYLIGKAYKIYYPFERSGPIE